MDDYPNLYFTIKEENSTEERQTIANRLKRNPIAPSHDTPGDDNADIREMISQNIFDHLVEPYVAKVDACDDQLTKEISAECINVILSQIGLVSVGIGSVRYNIAQTMASLERRFLEMIPSVVSSLYDLSSLLRCIALASGCGIHTRSTPIRGRSADIKLSTITILTSLLEPYHKHSQLLSEKSETTQHFHSSVAMWLSVSLNEVNDGDLLRDVTSILLVLSNFLLGYDSDRSILLMNAVAAFQISTQKCIDYCSGGENEMFLFEMITKCFVDIPDATTLWLETYASLLKQYKVEAPSILMHSANTYSEKLCKCLSLPAKSWSAFQLLMIQAKMRKPTGSCDEVVMSPAFESLVSVWIEKLDEAEATELEDDIRVVSLWLPGTMMALVQRIGQPATLDEYYSDGNLRMGSLLTWILFLEIFDKAGAVDMRNRSSMCSFLQKCNAVRSIMQLALKDANLDVSRKENIFDCIATDGAFDLAEIATLAIFRTIEVSRGKVKGLDIENDMILPTSIPVFTNTCKDMV